MISYLHNTTASELCGIPANGSLYVFYKRSFIDSVTNTLLDAIGDGRIVCYHANMVQLESPEKAKAELLYSMAPPYGVVMSTEKGKNAYRRSVCTALIDLMRERYSSASVSERVLALPKFQQSLFALLAGDIEVAATLLLDVTIDSYFTEEFKTHILACASAMDTGE